MTSVESKKEARGTATRERLIDAALTLFGRRGFDGVGAREIAKAAGAQLAAIPYHFGTKEALYQAVLRRVRERLAKAIGPAVLKAQAALDGSAGDAAAALSTLQRDALEVIAGREEAADWARLLMREHLDPSNSFDIVYDYSGRDLVDLFARLIARASGREPDDEAVLIEAFARSGEVLIFRVTQHALLRRMGWERLDAERIDQIGCVIETLGRR